MARKKKNNSTMREPDSLFEGVPVDELGIPATGAEIPEEDLEHAPVDPKSVRIATEYRRAVSKKAAGESGVPFNVPDPYKYNGMARVHPEAKVLIAQIDPPDDKIPATTVSHLGDYDAMRAWVRENFWDPSKTTKYEWAIHSGSYPYASGYLIFQAQPKEDPMSRYGQQPPHGMPPQMPPPHGMHYYGQQPYPPQQYAPPPPQPPPQQVAPQLPQPQPVQVQLPPIQVPAGIDPTLATMLQELMRQNAELRFQLDQQRMYAMYPQVQQPTAPQQAPSPPAVPPAPKGPLDLLGEMSSMVRQVKNFHSEMTQQFSDGPETPEPAATPLQSDEGFPLKVKDFGAIRAVATADGEVSMPFFANIDKYEGMFDGLLEKATKFLDKVGDKRTAHIREQVELMERAEGVASRTATVRGQPQQQALPPQHPTTPTARVQAPTPVRHPWDKFTVQRPATAPKPDTSVEEPPAPLQEPVKEAQVVETQAEVAD